MAEKILHGPDVGATLDETSRERMAQCIITLLTNSGWCDLLIGSIRFSDRRSG